ncbi:protein yippee-like At4g27745 isoform X2 [Salvia miltiorrhiza]|uniref:protein yippee-like At4g27745 isoform X2 n=1 Tax=Salvia miltiorrhiza TaxID=226208 RepID=UPI0025AB893C|nr:protein yippee-like At4g27745 isoform X2 [Salvia miltiorrhiza]
MGDSIIGGPRIYSCYKCRNHVALHDDIVSKAFQHVCSGKKEDRQMMTGLHMVADVHCADCREVLGWKYEKAYEESQKYKEGKFVLEKYKIVKENW